MRERITGAQRPIVTMAGLPSVNGSPADGDGVSTVT
jgi:hypothetical protein